MDDSVKKQQHDAGWECPACSMKRETDHGPDPCLGMLPDVKYACCGHGGSTGTQTQGYIYFSNGKVIRFKAVTASYDHGQHDYEEIPDVSRRT